MLAPRRRPAYGPSQFTGAGTRSVRDRRAHLDPARRGFRPLGDHDLQHAVAAAGGHAFGIGAVGQSETPMEAAIASLHPREALRLGGRFAAAFATDGEDALVHL